MVHQPLAIFLVSLAVITSCADPSDPECSEEFVAEASDFTCLREWRAVGSVRVRNVCGKEDEAADLLANPQPGVTMPVGTLVQVLPGEAMVKRGGGFDPAHGGWEFFNLAPRPGGTRIISRGPKASNVAGRCLDCHSKASDHDFLCGAAHECPPSVLRNHQFEWTQYADPRCLP